MAESYLAFGIWTLCFLLFLAVGISSWRSKEEVGFFTGVKPKKMKDVTAYNHAVAKLWFVFAVLFELIGIPLLHMEQNSPYAFIVSFLVMALIFGLIITYLIIESKYKA